MFWNNALDMLYSARSGRTSMTHLLVLLFAHVLLPPRSAAVFTADSTATGGAALELATCIPVALMP